MLGLLGGSTANAAFFVVSPGGVRSGTGKNKRECAGEIGRAAGFPLVFCAGESNGLSQWGSRSGSTQKATST
jgi:hypothetical protein